MSKTREFFPRLSLIAANQLGKTEPKNVYAVVAGYLANAFSAEDLFVENVEICESESNVEACELVVDVVTRSEFEQWKWQIEICIQTLDDANFLIQIQPTMQVDGFTTETCPAATTNGNLLLEIGEETFDLVHAKLLVTATDEDPTLLTLEMAMALLPYSPFTLVHQDLLSHVESEEFAATARAVAVDYERYADVHKIEVLNEPFAFDTDTATRAMTNSYAEAMGRPVASRMGL